jgi:branched-chain amino acid transport system permease protein
MNRASTFPAQRQAYGLVLLVLFALTWGLDAYWLYQAILLMATMITLMGMVLLTGQAGQISLGQGAFVALGAYLSVVLTQIAPLVPPGFALLIAPAGGFILGGLFGWAALRWSGHLLALATFSLALAIPQALKLPALARLTGGSQGMVLERPAAPGWIEALGISAGTDAWLYWIALACTTLSLVLARRLQAGPLGRAWIAARDHPLAAQSVGVRVAQVRTLAFALAAAYAALAGVLQVWATGFVAPDSFPVFLSISLLVGLVIGGARSVWGALIGAAFIHVVPKLTAQWSTDIPWAIYGVLLIMAVWLLPDGVAPYARGLLERARGLRFPRARS